jgi:anti-sigma regulatory factor (Ser/Thr protein kinase)
MALSDLRTSSTMVLPHGAAGVGQARRRLSRELTAAGAARNAVDDAALVLSELLSNAFRHARPIGGAEHSGTVRVAWRIDPGELLTVEVTDGGGPTAPRPPRPSLTASGGRGLGIVAALALEWGVRAGERGHRPVVTVWAVLAL